MARKSTKKGPQPRQRGSVIPRGKDTWLVRVYVGKNEGTGKREYHNETVKGTEKDAQKALTRILRDLDTGTYVAPTSDIIEGFYEPWLETKRNITNKTREGYRLRIRRDIIPVLGKKKIGRITKMDVELVVTAMEKNGYSPRTIHMTHSTLSMMLDAAVQSGLLLSNPAGYVELPKLPPKGSAASVLTEQQVGKLLKATQNTRYYPLWALLLTAGLRPSEALALRWEDYDGERVFVRRALEQDPKDNHRYKPTDTKTYSSKRAVPLFQIAIDALEDHRAKQRRDIFSGKLKGNPEGIIFPTREGTYFNVGWIRRAWMADLQAAGLPEVRLYDTRHTHLTHLVAAGVNPKVVQERAGHANIGITLDTYTHLAEGVQKEVVDEVQKKLKYMA